MEKKVRFEFWTMERELQRNITFLFDRFYRVPGVSSREPARLSMQRRYQFHRERWDGERRKGEHLLVYAPLASDKPDGRLLHGSIPIRKGEHEKGHLFWIIDDEKNLFA